MTTGVPAVELGSRRRASLWLADRRWALGAATLVVVTGMAFSLYWGPLAQGRSVWLTPGDIWGTYRAAHFVGWGDIGDLYASSTNLVTFPAIAVVLAPVAMLTGALGLSESYPFTLSHPSAWLVLGPVEMALGALVLLPLDALARQMGLSVRARATLAFAGAIALWPVVVIWGHPEDAVAMAAACAGLVAALRGRWRSCGLLLGLAIAFQPLVILMTPVIFLGVLPTARQRLGCCVRAVVPSAVLLAIPLARQWHATTYALLKQPNFPSIDHATPLLFLAPVLNRSAVVRQSTLPPALRVGGKFVTTPARFIRAGEVVAAGPGRTVAVALALALGVWAWRRREQLPKDAIVWLLAVCLALRCVFESVMDPYYLWPPLAVALVLCARSRWRLGFFMVSGGFITWWSYGHRPPWEWWAPIMVGLGVCLVASCPWSTLRAAIPTGPSPLRRTEVAELTKAGESAGQPALVGS